MLEIIGAATAIIGSVIVLGALLLGAFFVWWKLLDHCKSLGNVVYGVACWAHYGHLRRMRDPSLTNFVRAIRAIEQLQHDHEKKEAPNA